eukprot:g3055.t1
MSYDWGVLVENLGAVSFECYGDASAKGQCLVICNHRTRLDWMFLWSYFSRINALESLKIVLKAGLKSVPFIGWAMQCFRFIFLSRSSKYWDRDKAYVSSVLQSFGNVYPDLRLLVFPEGTDLSVSNIEKGKKWAKKNGLSTDRKYTLHPRTKGFVHLVQTMRSTSQEIFHVEDLTIAYVDRGERPSEKSIGKGTLPQKVIVRSVRYAESALPKSDDGLEQWLRARFEEKEKLLAAFYNGSSTRSSIPSGFGKRIAFDNRSSSRSPSSSRRGSRNRAVLFWVLSLATLLASAYYAPVLWISFSVLSALLFVSVGVVSKGADRLLLL